MGKTYIPLCAWPGCKAHINQNCIKYESIPTCESHSKGLRALTRKFSAFAPLVLVYFTAVITYIKAGKPASEKKVIQEARATIVNQTQLVLSKQEGEAKAKQQQQVQQQELALLQQLEAAAGG